MSNLAEKLPRFVKDKLEVAESRRQDIVNKLDTWVETNLPNSVVEPIKTAEKVSVDAIKDAATAAGDELVTFIRDKWTVLRGGKETAPAARTPVPKTSGTKKPAAKKPAAKKPAAKKPAAKKPAAKKPAAKKPAAKKP
ncbi:MAG: hypothetical protein VYA30_01425, partial [Myxococcota bacterium]|nr:hypothetical protein [Myxococcota bacterium]